MIRNGPISAVERTCVPPQSSRENPSISTTRTSSPYFSPKSAIAPRRRASSIGVTNVRTGIASKTFSLTIRSTRVFSSGVSGWVCEKSKRSLSGRTAEPACLTWSPSTSRSAAWSRCVAVWFACVGKRSLQLTTASTRVSGASGACSPSSTTSTWSSPNLRTSATCEPLLLAVDDEVPRVAHLAAARRVERRLLELDELPRATRRRHLDDRGEHRRLRVADELARPPPGLDELRRSLLRRALAAARETSRCSSISSRNPSTSTGWPRSSASSCVSSIGKP